MAAHSVDLRHKLLLVGAPLAVGVVAAAAILAYRVATRQFEAAAARAVALAAQRAAAVVELYMEERTGAARLLAHIPATVRAARAAGERARLLGLPGLDIDTLENRYAATRTLGPAPPEVTAFLTRVRDASDFVEIFFTDRHGFTVAASNPTSDFVQSDEAWWQGAMESGTYQDAPEFDESAGAAAVGITVRIDDPDTGEPVGVLKALLELSRLTPILTPPGDTLAVTIEVADSAGRVVATPDPARLLRPWSPGSQAPLTGRTEVTRLAVAGGEPEIVAATPTNQGRWWILARDPVDAAASAAPIVRIVGGAALALLALVLGVMVWLATWLHRRVTRPVRAAGDVASRVAAGDLSITLGRRDAGSEEVTQLLASVETMVSALRRLVGQIRTAAEDSAAMAQQISASTQEMSASTQEMATTCQSLTEQATQEADTVRAAADDAARILSIATQLADGAREAADRSTALEQLAQRHRDRLRSGSEQLAGLARDLERGAADAQALADRSEEIRKFVVQAREIGAQTNMLALNAAIEASRAGGGDSRGFAVVADEVRKLATQASRAAGTTAETVRSVLDTVQATRDRLTQLARSSAGVREIADAAAAGLDEVARGAAETSRWTGDISKASAEVRTLVEEITRSLESLAQGTEGVVAAAEQIAASAQEQSASTEEIAGSASHLAESAERLTSAVSSFRILRDGRRTADTPAPQPATAETPG